MTENNLKKMIENHELDNLMTNGEELERLKNSRTTEQVLEILKKYNYTETKEVFERELLEILQSIKLNEEEMKNVSGGKVLDKKYLAVLMGGLTMAGATGLPTYAKVEDNRGIRKELKTGVLNTVDRKNVGLLTTGLFVGGFFVEALNLMCRKPKIEYREKVIEKEIEKDKIIEEIIKDEHFSLTEEQKKIYENTKQLSEMILEYVEDYIRTNEKMPARELHSSDPAHQKILNLIGEIRKDWLNMYDNIKGVTITSEQKKNVMENKEEYDGRFNVFPVKISDRAVEDLFYGLPVGTTRLEGMCFPEDPADCTHNEMTFLGLLCKLDATYRKEFNKLAPTEKGPIENEEIDCCDCNCSEL